MPTVLKPAGYFSNGMPAVQSNIALLFHLREFMEKFSPHSVLASHSFRMAGQRIKEGTVEGLRAALQVDPANARVTTHLGRRLADRAREQGSDPDEARRARGEADFLTSRALKLAPDSDEVKRLHDEVVKLLEVKTEERIESKLIRLPFRM
jgi:hypothetical protein